ncbi:MAG: hypothetical protein ACE5KH_00400 [Candidatus Geothermarchaeales archaeon]
MTEKAYERHAWIILFTLGVLLMLSALAPFSESVAGPDEGDQRAFGVSWVDLQASNPGAASLISFQYRIFGLAWLGFAFFVTAVSLKSYRKGERWAWYALWILPAVLGLFVATVYVGGNTGLAIQYTVPLALSLFGLLLPYRKFFPEEAQSA